MCRCERTLNVRMAIWLGLTFSVLFQLQTSSAQIQKKPCGPPDYCARTDRRIEPYQSAVPALGPAPFLLRDPGFGSQIVRVTDEKSDPNGAGRSMMTPASAEANSWNANGTQFYVLTAGGQYVLYNFDPLTMRAQQKGVVHAPWFGEPEFSYVRPNVLYGVRAHNPAFQAYDTSSGERTRLHLIADCVHLTESDFAKYVTISRDDRRMATLLGPGQDRDFMVYVYDREQGCRWYNTKTGDIGGQWGPQGHIAMPDRCLLHNARISKSGEYMWLVCGSQTIGKGWLLWEIATTNVFPCPSLCSGHHAMGYSHVIGPSGATHPLDLLLRPFNQMSNMRHLISDLQPPPSARYWYDQHFSWNHTNRQDTTPVCLTTYSESNPNTPGAPLDTVGPWENEVLCVETDDKDSRVWRFAHTYSTAKNGFWSTPRGNVSQDGRFFMFTSDWQDQLGHENQRKEYRTDVFIVELR